MKRNLIYLVASLLLMGNISLLTSCRNGVDDEYLELQNPGDNNSGDEPQPSEPVDLNGDYVNGGDKDLVMTYNGAPLTGRKVTVLADENNETATITLAGNETDLSSAIGGLLDFKITPYSPVPGEKEIVLNNVKLYTRDDGYYFFGEDIQPTRTFSYSGEIKDDIMTIDCRNVLANDELAGVWKLAAQKTSNSNTEFSDFSPMWVDWNSKVVVDMGSLNLGLFPLPLKYSMNGIFALLLGGTGNMVVKPNGIGGLILSLIDHLEAKQNGELAVTYPWTDESGAQGLSTTDMNTVRYYYGDTPGRFYAEVNADVLLNLLSGLINGITTRAADPEHAKELGRELLTLLKPVLEEGLPIDYSLEGNQLRINPDGVLVRDLLRKLMELANDEYVAPIVQGALDGLGLGDFKKNVVLMLQNMPAALQYYDGDGTDAKPYTGECGYVKIGFKLEKQ
jgi:hypothetical protein